MKPVNRLRAAHPSLQFPVGRRAIAWVAAAAADPTPVPQAVPAVHWETVVRWEPGRSWPEVGVGAGAESRDSLGLRAEAEVAADSTVLVLVGPVLVGPALVGPARAAYWRALLDSGQPCAAHAQPSTVTADPRCYRDRLLRVACPEQPRPALHRGRPSSGRWSFVALRLRPFRPAHC